MAKLSMKKAYPTVQLCKKCRQAWKTETDLQSNKNTELAGRAATIRQC